MVAHNPQQVIKALITALEQITYVGSNGHRYNTYDGHISLNQHLTAALAEAEAYLRTNPEPQEPTE